jgi:hypothetical protein
MRINSFPLFLCAAISIAAAPLALAGVRHSRSQGGTGPAIPKSEQKKAPAVEQTGQPVPSPFTAPQIPEQQQITAPQGQPAVVPAPVPVQLPQQMSFEPPVQIPQQGTGQIPQQPVPVPQQGAGQVPQQPVQFPQQQLQIPQQPVPVPQQGGGEVPQQPMRILQPPAAADQPVVVPPPQRSGQPLPQQGLPSQPPISAAASLSERYVQPSFGMAGCGLGSMIFKDNVRSEQWLASILNEALIPQSIVITTGTSNCVDVDEEQMQAEQEIFIDTNLHALKLESARGEGESLRAFSDLLGCQKEGLFDTFASSAQGQHSFIFSDSMPSSIAERYRDVLKRSRALKSRCERLF